MFINNKPFPSTYRFTKNINMKLTLIKGSYNSGKSKKVSDIISDKYKNSKIYYYYTDGGINDVSKHYLKIFPKSGIYFRDKKTLREIELDIQTYVGKDCDNVIVIDSINFIPSSKKDIVSKYDDIISRIRELGKRNSLDIIMTLNTLESFDSSYENINRDGIQVIRIPLSDSLFEFME